MPVRGLSPHVRGNRDHLRNSLIKVRSIPACTGEPGLMLFMPGSGTVYPRVYGGTSGESTQDWP